VAGSVPVNTGLKGKVLCIEDSPISMFMVESAFDEYPHVTLLKAATAAEGISMARQEHPDLVLLDMNLPDMNGLEVVRALNEATTSGHMRLVLLTADALSMDIVKCLSLGASGYWRKPLGIDQLRDGLERALTRSSRKLP
jgi:CheY-like chemotaxis protein